MRLYAVLHLQIRKRQACA